MSIGLTIAILCAIFGPGIQWDMDPGYLHTIDW